MQGNETLAYREAKTKTKNIWIDESQQSGTLPEHRTKNKGR
jgi:hypothetical protein